ENELRAAAEILGVGTVVVLDHLDSGMEGEPERGALVTVPESELAVEVRALIDQHRPDVLVSLDASDGHRDHARVRDATLQAVDDASHRPLATYLWCLARSSMARWADHMRTIGGGDAYVDVGVGVLGTPDEEITTILDVREHLATRWAAIRAHSSQASPYDDLPPELQEEFLVTDRLRLVRGVDVLGPQRG
ncbi:MAG TPA: PIG-L family deacetylase, partial [Acidimicrobiales bacterium]